MQARRMGLAVLVFLPVFFWCALADGVRFESMDSEYMHFDSMRILAGKKPLTIWPPGLPILFVPFSAVERAVPPGDDEGVRLFWIDRLFSLLPALSAGGVAVFLFLFLLRLEFGGIAAAWLALLGFFGTILAPYGQMAFSEIQQAFFYTGGMCFFMAFLDTRRLRALVPCGILMGFLALLKLTLAIPGAALGVALLWTMRNERFRRQGAALALFGLPFVSGVLGYLAYNCWRSGDWLNFGYSTQIGDAGGFSGSLLNGVYGQLLSPGKSVFLYSLALIFLFWGWRDFYRRRPPLAAAFLISSVLLILVYSLWHMWAGDWSWGPRFLVPLTGVAFLPAALGMRAVWRRGRPARAAVAGVCLLSVAEQIPPSLVNFNSFSALNIANQFLEESASAGGTVNNLTLEHFVPACTPLLGAPWLMIRSIQVAEMQRKGRFGDFSVKWDGEIQIPDTPSLQLRLQCQGRARVRIDGDIALGSTKNPPGVLEAGFDHLSPGWHDIFVKFRQDGDDPSVHLEWKTADMADFEAVPASALRHGDRAGGLRGSYYLDVKWDKKWRERFDGMIAFDWRDTTPFDEWLARGYPPLALYNERQLPRSPFGDWAFYLDAWPAQVFLHNALWGRGPGPRMLFGALIAGLSLSFVALVLATLIRHGRRQTEQ